MNQPVADQGKLKCCPFCGGEASIKHTQRRHDFDDAVECSNEDCGVFIIGNGAAWNRRVPESMQDTEMLDWLGKKTCGASDSERYLPFRIYWGGGTHKTIREVIAAAMQKESQG